MTNSKLKRNPRERVEADDKPEGAPWLLARVKPGLAANQEGYMALDLDSAGYEYYRPVFCRRKRVRTKFELCYEPLYREYMFVRRRWIGSKALSSCFGVVGKALGTVDHKVIRRHRLLEVISEARQVIMHDPSGQEIIVGDTVETLDGLLRAVVLEKDPLGRVTLLSQFMGGSSKLVVPLHRLRKVPRVHGQFIDPIASEG